MGDGRFHMRCGGQDAVAGCGDDFRRRARAGVDGGAKFCGRLGEGLARIDHGAGEGGLRLFQFRMQRFIGAGQGGFNLRGGLHDIDARGRDHVADREGALVDDAAQLEAGVGDRRPCGHDRVGEGALAIFQGRPQRIMRLRQRGFDLVGGVRHIVA